MKISAPASCGPTRETALLIADATPELCTGTDLIKAVVSGATVMHMPIPKMIVPGRKSTKYEPGGREVEGSPGLSNHAALLTGTRLNQSTPSPAIAGPIAMNQRGPNRPAREPKRAARKMRKSDPGMPPAPAAAAA